VFVATMNPLQTRVVMIVGMMRAHDGPERQHSLTIRHGGKRLWQPVASSELQQQARSSASADSLMLATYTLDPKP
jgi:hypothetical protein